MSSERENAIINTKSIQFKTWIYFFLMAVFILLILWVIQIIFFKAYYHSMKTGELEKAGKQVVKDFSERGDSDFKETLQKVAHNNSSTVVLFAVDCIVENGTATPISETAKVFYLATPYGDDKYGKDTPEPQAPVINIEKAFFKEALTKPEFMYTANLPGGAFLVYGAVIDDAVEGNVYMHMATPLVPMDATASVLKNQLLIVTVICVFLSIILSWFVANRISKPITEFSRVARNLAKGDYDVKFVGNGYSEIEDLADTLNYATQEISRAETLRRDFLANVSHDLRTPLTMVKAYAEMIRDISGADENKRKMHSQVIIDESDRLTNLVNDILDLSKLQADMEKKEPDDVNLGNLVNSVVERFSIMREKNGYNFIVETDENCIVQGDSSRFEQVLYNLIGNAINYTGEDKKVTVRAKLTGGFITVSVTDTGKGIAPEDIDAVWDRYYRANQSKRKVVGTGLGLSIVKNILTTYHAEFGIESSLGAGSTFWFKLPQFSQNVIIQKPQSSQST